MSGDLLPDTSTTTRGCDLCGEISARELYNAMDRLRNPERPFTIAACTGCGVLRTLPEMTDQELSAFYPADYWGQSSEPSEAWIRSSQSDKLEFFRLCSLREGRILDVGCGSGWFLRTLDSGSWDRFGVETGKEAGSVAALSLGADHFSGTGLLQAALPDAHFDVITFWSALEHMNAPRANLLEARRIVKKGGTIIVQVPNAAGYQARLFKGKWFALDVPRHRYHFSPKALERLLTQTGFKSYHATTFSRVHNAHALRQSLKSTLGAATSWGGYLLFCMAIPLIKPADWLMTPLAGGATLTVAARAIE
jgi:2-polyprenyl-3-methyl-5-hydroxy-6-metoxy-1,4-benzoquinol methylase